MSDPRPQKTVLIVSRFFPPMFDVGGKRAWRFASHLPRHGWRAVVLTDRPSRGHAIDPTLKVPENVEVCQHYYPRWWPRPSGAGSNGTAELPIPVQPESNDLLHRARRQFRVPVGEEIIVAPRVAWLARQIVRRVGAQAIFATSSPYSALVFGAAAARATGLPLCLDLRDPWSLNFLQEDKPAWVQRVEARIEHRLLSSADRVTFTSEATTKAYRERFPDIPAERFRTIYNSFDPQFRPPARGETDGILRIVHFGNVYGRRSLAPVLEGLAILRARARRDAGRVVLVNLGRVTEADLALSNRLGLDGCFEYRPFIPYEEGLNLLARSSVQLLLGYGDETLYLPAKLFDYLMTRVPILCVAPPSELTRIVHDTGSGTSVDPGDPQGIADALARALVAPDRLSSISRDEARIGRFSATETAHELAAVLDEMIGEGNPGRPHSGLRPTLLPSSPNSYERCLA
jgi:glycosyltransferase involved in cell wall biosynthesis